MKILAFFFPFLLFWNGILLHPKTKTISQHSFCCFLFWKKNGIEISIWLISMFGKFAAWKDKKKLFFFSLTFALDCWSVAVNQNVEIDRNYATAEWIEHRTACDLINHNNNGKKWPNLPRNMKGGQFGIDAFGEISVTFRKSRMHYVK